jgi:hypothetical protein
MANKEHLAQLKQGVDSWNRWRREHPTIYPDLAGADLRRTFLDGANLRGAFLDEVDLRGAFLDGADLRGASLRGASLREAVLRDANLAGADLARADLREAVLRRTFLDGANLPKADLRGASLRGASLRRAFLNGADLAGADLRGASLAGADLDGVVIGEPIRYEIEVEIVLPQENINHDDLKQLQSAIDNLMEICEFNLKEEFAPILGSWWQTLIFWSKNETTQTIVNRLFQTLKEVFVARSIGIPSAEETVKLAEAVDQVLKSLEPFESGVIRFGKLLVIKGTLKGKPVLRVETVSSSLAQKLAENPQLIKMPEPLLPLIEEQEMANQTASDSVVLDKPQVEFLPDDPLVPLPPNCRDLQ